MVDLPALLRAALTTVVPATVVEELLAVAEADAAFLAPKSRESLYYRGAVAAPIHVHVTSNATHLKIYIFTCRFSC